MAFDARLVVLSVALALGSVCLCLSLRDQNWWIGTNSKGSLWLSISGEWECTAARAKDDIRHGSWGQCDDMETWMGSYTTRRSGAVAWFVSMFCTYARLTFALLLVSTVATIVAFISVFRLASGRLLLGVSPRQYAFWSSVVASATSGTALIMFWLVSRGRYQTAFDELFLLCLRHPRGRDFYVGLGHGFTIATLGALCVASSPVVLHLVYRGDIRTWVLQRATSPAHSEGDELGTLLPRQL